MGIKVDHVRGYEVLDSRGNPTVEAEVLLSDGSVGIASVPSERLPECLKRQSFVTTIQEDITGGVTQAVKNVNSEIRKSMIDAKTIDQGRIDSMLINLDGTE